MSATIAECLEALANASGPHPVPTMKLPANSFFGRRSNG